MACRFKSEKSRSYYQLNTDDKARETGLIQLWGAAGVAAVGSQHPGKLLGKVPLQNLHSKEVTARQLPPTLHAALFAPVSFDMQYLSAVVQGFY